MSDPMALAEQVLEDAGLLPRLVTDRNGGQAVQAQSCHSRQPSVLGASGTTGTTGAPNVTESDERKVRLTPASAVPLRRVTWAWKDRLPAGQLTLLGGREGIGKSLWQSHLAARLSRGTLTGEHHGTPSAVLVVASEDDWPRTVAPRLVAAGADLEQVYRVDVTTAGDLPGSLTLPLDVVRLERAVRKVAAVAVFLDPLVTVLDGSLDAHRDREVRAALEPLAQLAHRTGTLVNGLVHLGKSDRVDVVTAVLGSRAFTAVSRAVLVAARDPDAEDGACVLSVEKANLGRLDVPGLRYKIESAAVPTPEGLADVGRLVLLGESDRQVRDFYADHADADERSDREEAADWLRAHLTASGGEAAAAAVFEAAKAAGISKRTLQRARPRAGVQADRLGFPAGTVWRLTTP